MDAQQESTRQAKLHALAAESGYSKQTIAWIGYSIGLGSRAGASPGHVNAETVCRMLISDINQLHPGDLEGTLSRCGIQSSKDVGKIVFGLVANGLIKASDEDSEEDFSDVFDTANIEAFLVHARITRRRFNWRVIKRRTAWTLYFVGGAIVAMSYISRIPALIAWTGWATGMFGFMMFYLPDAKTGRFGMNAAEFHAASGRAP